ELQVAAPEVVDGAHLVGVGGGQVGPELVEVGVHGPVDGRGARAVVDHARRRDRQLRQCRGHLVGQEQEVVGEDRLFELDPAGDRHPRRVERGLARLVVHGDAQLLVGLRDAAELVDEVHVPGPAAELAVGGRLEADALLHRDRLHDRRVLRLLERLAGDVARAELLAGVQQGRGTQQAPDVVGAERRLGSLAHGRHASAPGCQPTTARAAAVRTTRSSSQRRAVNSERGTETPSAAVTSPSAPSTGAATPATPGTYSSTSTAAPSERIRISSRSRARRSATVRGANRGNPVRSNSSESRAGRRPESITLPAAVACAGVGSPTRRPSGRGWSAQSSTCATTTSTSRNTARYAAAPAAACTSRSVVRSAGSGRTCSVRLRCSSATRYP